MEHIAAILLVVGCSGDLSECRELPAPVPLFETAEDCEATRGRSAAAYGVDGGQVFAVCVPVDPALEEQDAELVWDIVDDRLVASIEVTDVIVATNSRATGHASVTME
ncbi:MAG: hypothetical protein AB7I79_04240 [Rhizobiaceae bacterium]